MLRQLLQPILLHQPLFVGEMARSTTQHSAQLSSPVLRLCSVLSAADSRSITCK
jgi:hypothetical protein